jgi:hypothetical protein
MYSLVYCAIGCVLECTSIIIIPVCLLHVQRIHVKFMLDNFSRPAVFNSF